MKTYAHWLTPVHVIVFSNIFHTYIINCSLLLYYSLALQFSMLFPSHASRRFRTMIGFMRYLLVYSLTVSIMHSLNIHMHKIPTAAAVLQTYFFIKKTFVILIRINRLNYHIFYTYFFSVIHSSKTKKGVPGGKLKLIAINTVFSKTHTHTYPV